MFAYCNNNPVLYSDRFGTIPYNDSWLDESFREAGRLLYEFFTGRTHPDRQAAEMNDTIIVEQNEFISDAVNNLWDAYVHYNTELQPQAQYNQDMAVIAQWDDITQNPVRTGDFAAMTVSNVLTYASYVAFVANPAVSAGVALVGTVAASVWSTLRYYGVISE